MSNNNSFLLVFLEWGWENLVSKILLLVLQHGNLIRFSRWIRRWFEFSSNISTNLPTFTLSVWTHLFLHLVSSYWPWKKEQNNSIFKILNSTFRPIVEPFNVMALIMRKLFNMRRLVLMSDVARRSMQRNFLAHKMRSKLSTLHYYRLFTFPANAFRLQTLLI